MTTHTEHFESTVQLDSGLIIPASAAVGKVLSSDASGNATWKFPGEASVAMAYRNAAQGIPSGAFTRVKLDKVIKDPGTRINAEGSYTVPSDGYYAVYGQVGFQGISALNTVIIASIVVNGTEKSRGVRQTHENGAVTGEHDVTVAGIIFCKAGEKIELDAFQNTGVEIGLAVGSEVANYMHVSRVGEGPPGPENSLVETSIAMAYRAAVQKIPSGGFHKVILDKVAKDPGGNVNTSTGVYTAPADGYYHVDGAVRFVAKFPNGALAIFVNGAEALLGTQTLTNNVGLAVAGILSLKKGDVVELQVQQESGEELSISGETSNRLHVARVGSGQTGPEGPEGKAKPGAWTALEELSAKLEPEPSGFYFTPGMRLEPSGDVVRLRGVLKVKTANTFANAAPMFKVPLAFRPASKNVRLSLVTNAGGVLSADAAAQMEIASNGETALYVPTTLTAKSEIPLDGITYSIA